MGQFDFAGKKIILRGSELRQTDKFYETEHTNVNTVGNIGYVCQANILSVRNYDISNSIFRDLKEELYKEAIHVSITFRCGYIELAKKELKRADTYLLVLKKENVVEMIFPNLGVFEFPINGENFHTANLHEHILLILEPTIFRLQYGKGEGNDIDMLDYKQKIFSKIMEDDNDFGKEVVENYVAEISVPAKTDYNIMEIIATHTQSFELIFNKIKITRHTPYAESKILCDEISEVRVFRDVQDSPAIKFEFEHNGFSQIIQTYEDLIDYGITLELGYGKDVAKEEEYVGDGPDQILEIIKSKQGFKLIYQEPFYKENGYTLLQLTE